jgi:hypothetical protein
MRQHSSLSHRWDSWPSTWAVTGWWCTGTNRLIMTLRKFEHIKKLSGFDNWCKEGLDMLCTVLLCRWCWDYVGGIWKYHHQKQKTDSWSTDQRPAGLDSSVIKIHHNEVTSVKRAWCYAFSMLNKMQSTSRSNEKQRWKVSMSLRDNKWKFHTEIS